MLRIKLLLLVALWIPLAGAADSIAGTWRGESICTSKPSACHDETVIYHFASVSGKPNTFSLSADKVVDGQAVNMGTLEFRYIENEHALVCDAPQGTWRFTIEGDKITGTLTRPDHTLFRRVSVRKDP
jgi:hypothetical protein